MIATKIIIATYCIEILIIILITLAKSNSIYNEKYNMNEYDEYDEYGNIINNKI